MSQKDTMSHPAMTAWQAQQLRMTVFPSLNSKHSEQNWWSEVIGGLPEKQEIMPRTGERVEEGLYGNGKMTLSVHPTRIDWRYDPNMPESPFSSPEFPTIGSFVENLPKFRELMSQWLNVSSNPSISRIAFGAILLQPVQSLREGYELLLKYIRLNLELQGASDFLYQINRPVDSSLEIPNLRINRLTKWSVGMFLQMQFAVNPSAAVTSSHQQERLYACRLELDVNTAADYKGELTPKRLTEIFNELTELGTQIAAEGDIP